jgi:hypothetical protein
MENETRTDERRPDAPPQQLARHALALARFLEQHESREHVQALKEEAALLESLQTQWEQAARAARVALFRSHELRERVEAAQHSRKALLEALSHHAETHEAFRAGVHALKARADTTDLVTLLEILIQTLSKPLLDGVVPASELTRAREQMDRLRAAVTGREIPDGHSEREHVERAEETRRKRDRQFWQLADLDRTVCSKAQEAFGHDYAGSGLFGGYVSLRRTIAPFAPTWAIKAPTHLARTTNPQTCAEHMPPLAAVFGGSLGCKAAMDAGQLVLVWNWTPRSADAVTQPDGYRVYASFNGQPPLLWGHQDHGVDWTTVAIPPPASGINVCYTVRAYQADQESADSNPLCIGDFQPGPSTKTVVLQPDQLNSFVTSDASDGYFTAAQTRVPRPPVDIVVGEAVHFAYTPPFQVFGYDWSSETYRGAIHFDLTTLQGKAIDSAILTYAETRAEHPGSVEMFDWHLCASDWLSGGSTWPEPAEWVAETEGAQGVQGPRAPIDVTSVVRQWTTSRVNLGFLLKQAYEGVPHDLFDRNHICYFANFQLEVKFYE